MKKTKPMTVKASFQRPSFQPTQPISAITATHGIDWNVALVGMNT